MSEIQMMWSWVRAYAHTTSQKATRSERGALSMETVLIAAGLAAIAITAVAVIAAKVRSKANSIPTD